MERLLRAPPQVLQTKMYNTNSIYILVQKKTRKAAMDQRRKAYNWTILYMQMV